MKERMQSHSARPGLTTTGEDFEMTASGFSRIGSYEVERMLSCHGQGIVFLARDPLMKRKVILKVYRCNGTVRTNRRLVNEARALTRLGGRGSPLGFAVERFGNSEFLVMEYLEGRTLRELLGSSVAPVRIAMQVLLQTAQALRFVHQAELVHLDIKPSNIIVTHNGVVKIIDFGLVQAIGKVQTAFSGTPAYMAPERLVVGSGPVDQRADIFSLGAVLYEMLTGKAPFSTVSNRRSRELGWDSINVAPNDIEKLGSYCSEICSRCLSKDLNRRYPSTAELQTALQRMIAKYDADHRRKSMIAPSRSIADMLLSALT